MGNTGAKKGSFGSRRTFLQNRFQILEAVEGAQDINLVITQNQQKLSRKIPKIIVHTSKNKLKCYLCNEYHPDVQNVNKLDVSKNSWTINVNSKGVRNVANFIIIFFTSKTQRLQFLQP